jgi:hypothetical protein
MNLPLFIPDADIGNKFGKLLDKYPVTPYLGNRDSFIRWANFMHNKVNAYLGKEEISLIDSQKLYYNKYKPYQETYYGETYAKKYVVYLNFALILALGVTVVMVS